MLIHSLMVTYVPHKNELSRLYLKFLTQGSRVYTTFLYTFLLHQFATTLEMMK